MYQVPRKPVVGYSSVPGPYQSNSTEEIDNKQQNVVQEWAAAPESPSRNHHGGDDTAIPLNEYPINGNGSRGLGPDETKRKGEVNPLRVLRAWWIEIVACILAIGGLMAIVGILYPHQNLPLPRLPYKLTINSLVSICIVVIKGAVLLIVAQGLSQLKWSWFKNHRPLKDFEIYDEASRGSIFGAVHLMWTLGHRHAVSSIGALIVILALAVDPFAQQVVYFVPCSANDTMMTASIPKANLYLGAAGTIGGPDHLGAAIDSVAIGMQAAINNGVFDPDNVQVKYSCSTGNCTFAQTYASIGFCSSCRDITSELTLTPADNSSGSINYTLPSGLVATSFETVFVMGVNYSTGYSAAGTLVQAIFAFNNSDLYGYAGQGGIVCFEGDEWGCQGYGAGECDIIPCVQTYNATIENGYLQEEVVLDSQSYNFNTSNDEFYLSTTVDNSCLNSSEKDYLQSMGHSLNSSSRWSAFTTNISIDASTYLFEQNYSSQYIIEQYYRNQSLNPECFYMVDYITLNSLLVYFDSVFGTSLPYENYGYGSTDGSSYLKQIYNVANVSFPSFESTFENLTRSMTTFVRQSSAQLYGTSTTGQVIKQVTCVRVRWMWLIFPAVLVALTLLFFVLLVIQTRFDTGGRAGGTGLAGGNLVYKSSALAALIHGLDTKTQEELGTTTRGSLDKVKKDAHKMYVKWMPTENGYKLAQTGPDGL